MARKTSAPTSAHFEKVLDASGVHIITRDLRTGWEWTARDIGSFTNAKRGSEAEKACKVLRLGGHSDWQLPEIHQLESIRDRSRFLPAIDTEFFPDCPSELFWSKTPDASTPSECAWVVGFYYGGSYLYRRGSRFRVRAVRGPSRQFFAL